MLLLLVLLLYYEDNDLFNINIILSFTVYPYDILWECWDPSLLIFFLINLETSKMQIFIFVSPHGVFGFRLEFSHEDKAADGGASIFKL